ncbi:RNA-binding protein 44 isoform X2 [Lissotriton helveticus]
MGPPLLLMSSVPQSMTFLLFDQNCGSSVPFFGHMDTISHFLPGGFLHTRAVCPTLTMNLDHILSFYSGGRYIQPFMNTATMGLEHFSEPPALVQENLCHTCREHRREILNRQVCELVTKNGSLEITDHKLLGWFMMLSAEDRNVIKESGNLVEYLKEHPALEIINNFVYLKAENIIFHKQMDSVSPSKANFNKSRRATFYSVWLCECCGFSNGFAVSKCKVCKSAMKKLERTVYLEDEELLERESMVSFDISESFASCIEEPRNDSSADDSQVIQQTSNTEMAISAFDPSEHCFVTANHVQISDTHIKLQEIQSSCSSEKIDSQTVFEFQLLNEGESVVDLSLDTAFNRYSQQQALFSVTLDDTKEDKDNSSPIVYSISTSQSQLQSVTTEEELVNQSTIAKSFSCHYPFDTFKSRQNPDTPKFIENSIDVSGELATVDANHAAVFKKTSFAPLCDAGDAVDALNSDRALLSAYRPMRQMQGDALKCEKQFCPDTKFPCKVEEPPANDDLQGSTDVADMSLSDLADASEILKFEMFGSVEDLNNNSKFHGYENSFAQPWRQYCMESLQTSFNFEPNPDIFDDSFQSALSASSSFDSLPSIPASEHPSLSVNDNHPACEEVKTTHATAPFAQGLIPSTGFQCLTCLQSAAGSSVSRVNQTVDVSSDFRAFFTTSKATSMERPLISRAENTEVTLIKCSTKRWPATEQKSIACNTDCCLAHLFMQDVASQTTCVETQEKLVSTDITTSDWNLLSQDYVQFRTSALQPKEESSQRKKVVSRVSERSHPFRCCVGVLERAVKAELQLLKTYHWMCRDRCWQMYKHAMEESGSLSSDLPGSFTEMGSALSSTLNDLKKKYDALREKILSGTPLDDLPQLSIEVKNKLSFADYVPAEIMKSDIEPDVNRLQSKLRVQKRDDVRISNVSQNVSLTADVLSESSCGTQYESFLDCEFASVEDSNLKDTDKTKEENEGWFDAKEKLTLNETCVAMQVDELELGAPEAGSVLEFRVAVASGCELEKGCYVHVAGLPPFISEDELMSNFLKYQVSKVFIEQFSLKCSYAIIFFNTACAAQTAVDEMNGKVIHGKGVRIRIINVAKKPAAVTQLEHRELEKNTVTKVTVCNPSRSLEINSPLRPPTMEDIKLANNKLAIHVKLPEEMPAKDTCPIKQLTSTGPAPKSDTALNSSHVNNLAEDTRPVRTTPFPWKVTNCTATPLMVPGSFPPPWFIPGSYPSPCWQVPASNACPWMINRPPTCNWLGSNTPQSPWPGASSTQTPFPGHGFTNCPWQHPSHPQASWSLNSFSPTISSSITSVKTSPKQTSCPSTKVTSATKEVICSATPSKDSNHPSIATQAVCLGPFKNTCSFSGLIDITESPLTSSQVTNSSTSLPKGATTGPEYSNDISFSVAPTTVTPSISKPRKMALPKVRVTASGLRKSMASITPLSKVPKRDPTSSTVRTSNSCTLPTNTLSCPFPFSSTLNNSVTAQITVASGSTTCVNGKDCAVLSSTISASPAAPVTQPSSRPPMVHPKISIEEKCEPCTPGEPAPFIPKNTVNVCSLNKLIKKLTDLHPEANRKQIVEALAEVRANNNGFLTGLPLDAIVVKASSVLAQSAAVP